MMLTLKKTINSFTDRFKSLHNTLFMHEKVSQALLVKAYPKYHNQQ